MLRANRDFTLKVLSYVLREISFFFVYRWRFSKVGSRSRVESPRRLVNASRVSIGNGSVILRDSRIEVIVNDDFFGKIKIGDYVEIGHNFFCTSAVQVEIGNGVLISDNVAIIDNNHKHCKGISPVCSGLTSTAIKIGNNVVIYRNATILSGVSIGEGAVIGANALVKENVADFSIVVGSPARLVGEVGGDCG